MTKSDIAPHVATRAASSNDAAKKSLNGIFSPIRETLAREETVTIAGFRTLSAKRRAAHQGRNPRTRESIIIAASIVPFLNAGKILRDAVN